MTQVIYTCKQCGRPGAVAEIAEDSPATLQRGPGRQTIECEMCGRVAVAVCGHCSVPPPEQPKRYTGEQIEEMILRWCGWPDRTIENVRHALKMDACGGVDGGPYTPPETT